MSDFDMLGRLHEAQANSVIAEWLSDKIESWSAHAERVGALQESGGQPDIVVREFDRMPVVIETEYDSPAVEDARSRLGETLVGETRPFTEIIAVGIESLCRQDTREVFRERLDQNESVFSVQLVTQRNGQARVWPARPLAATPSDLIAYCEYAQVPQAFIETRSGQIATMVHSASLKLVEGTRYLPDGEEVLSKLMDVVGGESPMQAMQTACAVWLTAVDLQNDLATYSDVFKDLGLKRTDSLDIIMKPRLLESWEIIKNVNYLPVVELAISSLETIPTGMYELGDVLSAIVGLSVQMNNLNAKHIYNFAGELWQRLVIDREERAAHYTKPEVAELLAWLGATRFANRTASEVAELDLMDAACGTGTLIGAGERGIRRLYRTTGSNRVDLHRARMENHIIAIDINGIAGTLTAKRLTDLDVRQVYGGSKVAVTDHEAGSLTLLDPNQTSISEVLGYRDVARTKDERGNIGLFHVGLEESGVDWSLMNPPYSRARGGRAQATKGLDSLRARARRRNYTLSHGQAGLGSDFGNLSLMRMKSGGVLSHVLPLTAAHAESWQRWRQGIETHFDEITAIANVGHQEESMSADTGMNEMLLVATKRPGLHKNRKWAKPTVLCVNLYAAPSTLAEGYALANEIRGISDDQDVGATENFSFVRMDVPTPGFPWYAVGNTSTEFVNVSCALMRGEAWDPLRLTKTSLTLDMTTMGELCVIGPTHHLIGHIAGSSHIGAFRWTSAGARVSRASHQSLWSADSKSQTGILVRPTHDGEVVDQDLAANIVDSQSEWFLSRNLRWTSQAVALAKTRDEAHGGSAWNALQIGDRAVAMCLALFYNSIFGAILRQVYGQSTQPGRARVQVRAIEGLPCPDFGARSRAAARARMIAGRAFDGLAGLEMEPFAYCFRDENRRQIDDTVARMLGLDHSVNRVQRMLARYRLLFAEEPNVNGRQKTIVAALEQFNES